MWRLVTHMWSFEFSLENYVAIRLAPLQSVYCMEGSGSAVGHAIACKAKH